MRLREDRIAFQKPASAACTDKERMVSAGPASRIRLWIITVRSCHRASQNRKIRAFLNQFRNRLLHIIEIITRELTAYGFRILLKQNLKISGQSLLHFFSGEKT